MSDFAIDIRKTNTTDGFIYQARLQTFDELAATRLIESIERITPQTDTFSRDAILMAIWELPFLALLYEEQCVKEGADKRKYRQVVTTLLSLVREKIQMLLTCK